jgi:hypothetical protein
MIKDVYLFTDGSLAVFDGAGKERADLEGKLTPELQGKILAECEEGTRITLARWKRGFFELTRKEFEGTSMVGSLLNVKFWMPGEKSSD